MKFRLVMFPDPCKIPNDTHVVRSFTDNSGDPPVGRSRVGSNQGINGARKEIVFISGKKGGKPMEARILGMYDKYMDSSGLHRFVFVSKYVFVIIFNFLA